LSVSLTFTASSGYELPDSVTVSGADYIWDKSTGILILSNVTLYGLSTFVRTRIDNGKSVKYIKLCGAGIDGDTIMTLNEPIE
jgi:hypothetical protein